MRGILEDLTKLPPKRLERKLEELAREALPSISVMVFDGNPTDGLTVGLHVESQGRRDVLDLARVLEIEPDGYVVSAWALLSPGRKHPYWRLLLRVEFERPVRCSFAVRLDVGDQPSDPLRATLPLILAADRFALAFDGMPDRDRPLVWVAAPATRECVFEVLAAVGVA
ncbi:MAG: hypothetical protein ACYC1P_12700 [Gaiellaceae bacterium]